MASDEHKKLANFIKETHNRLRQECQVYGPKEAWNRHISRTKDLQNYAVSMKELATSHWTQNKETTHKNTSTHCRIAWIRRQCYAYYFEGGKTKYNSREESILSKIPVDEPKNVCNSSKTEDFFAAQRIKILDVGSCYNPLGDDENFDVTPIDLAPYSDQVFKCDFLNVDVGDTKIVENRTIFQLEQCSFDVCVFSLLLEYLPSPEQRFLCCKKAYDVLKPTGLLIIITPDSKHVGANAKIMKSWRFVLSNLGFMRITYEKLRHVHCITFRKCANKKVAVRWAEMQDFSGETTRLFESLDKIFIPQDFHEFKVEEEEKDGGRGFDEEELSSGFQELPQLID